MIGWARCEAVGPEKPEMYLPELGMLAYWRVCHLSLYPYR
jgi:hypothetical protein